MPLMFRKALSKIKFTRFNECIFGLLRWITIITGERERNRPGVIKMSEREFNNAPSGCGSA